MQLRCLAGAYAGQIRDYPVPVAIAVLRTGHAERVDLPIVPLAQRAVPEVPVLAMPVTEVPIVAPVHSIVPARRPKR